MAIDDSIRALHDAEKSRGEVRTRLATEDMNEGQRIALDAELTHLDREIFRCARAINSELKDMAERRIVPDKPIQVAGVGDPDLRKFLAQVSETVEKLRYASRADEELGKGDKDRVAQERSKAKRLKQDSEDQKRELEQEKKKLAKIREDLAKEKQRLEREQKKVAEEREHMVRDKDRAAKDAAAIDERIERSEREKQQAERDRKDVANKLRAGPRDRAPLERQGQELGAKITRIDRRILEDKRLAENVDRARKNVDLELQEIDQAKDKIDKELARLDDEGKRLDEREKQLDAAFHDTDQRLDALTEAEAKLKS